MIEGIGGSILFSNDVKKLAEWYRDSLGILPTGREITGDSVYTTFEYRDLGNPETKWQMVWAIIPTKEDIKGKPRTGKINYRVKSLSEMLRQLESRAVVIEKTESFAYGKFAWLKDPEGKQIELWEPSED